MNIQENISLKKYTTFEIGGLARYFVTVTNSAEVRTAVAFAVEKNIPYFILGGGSNILVNDNGYEGIVIHIDINFCEIDGVWAHIGAGKNLLQALEALTEAGLSGLEGMAGVPGSIGGAVRGNAGAFGVEISDVVRCVHMIDLGDMQEKVLTQEECLYSYRQSIFKQQKTWLITSVECVLAQGDGDVIAARMQETIAAREEKHIQDIRSAGSFFMNPEVPCEIQEEFTRDTGSESRGGRVPAGWLLEHAGMECKRVGDIQAGEMHANYFINVGDGTAEQVVQLASLAKTRVRDEFDVQLKEEVHMIGFDNFS